MAENQSELGLKKTRILIALILAVFFLKGVFWVGIFPMFTGQDEARHYNSIQHLNEPAKKNWKTISRMHIAKKETFDDYNFSQEIVEAGKLTDFDNFRHELYNTVNFSRGFLGINEAEIASKPWKPYNIYVPADTAGTKDAYHKFGSLIEKILYNSDILVRFFTNRIFSVFLGAVSVLLSYLIAKNIGLKKKYCLSMAAIIALQPKLGMYLTNINYDALLIPTFFLFTLGGVLSLKDGLNSKNTALMLSAVILGILTKGTALVLFATFILIVAGHYLRTTKGISTRKIAIVVIAIFILLLSFDFTRQNLSKWLPYKNNFSETIVLTGNYLAESFTPGKIALSAKTYWGALGWNNDFIADNFTNVVLYIEILAGIGLIFFFLLKKKPDYLPEKKYIIFLIIMVLGLQIGIRMADLKMYMEMKDIVFGAPGRYFLPNLASHIILLFVGLGALLRKEKYFQYSLITGLILMFSFSMYLTFNVIIPRYYL